MSSLGLSTSSAMTNWVERQSIVRRAPSKLGHLKLQSMTPPKKRHSCSVWSLRCTCGLPRWLLLLAIPNPANRGKCPTRSYPITSHQRPPHQYPPHLGPPCQPGSPHLGPPHPGPKCHPPQVGPLCHPRPTCRPPDPPPCCANACIGINKATATAQMRVSLRTIELASQPI